MKWTLTTTKKASLGVEVLGFSPEWEDADFNPKGVRVGFFNENGTFTQAAWNDYQDRYVSDYDGDLPYSWAEVPNPKPCT
jgi:hypothetical protein